MVDGQIAALIGESPWTLRLYELQGANTYEQVRITLNHPFERVVRGLAKKYNLSPDPTRSDADRIQPPMKGVEELSRRSAAVRPPPGEIEAGDGADGTLRVHLRRERVCMGLPSLVCTLTGEAALDTLIDSELQPSRRRFFAWTRNSNLTSIGNFQEYAVYRPHPRDPRNATEYVSRVQVATGSWVGRKILSLVGGTGAGMIKQHVDLLQARLDEMQAGEEGVGDGDGVDGNGEVEDDFSGRERIRTPAHSRGR